ncbi:hypothetical protein DPMN_070510 [Dreissena polymorpha]|uniref:Uncharacterized protein n=1 Tax=Dreissena polymorpha TaxID=45954 RepID=A0A9D3Z583_DREPO|nr:hypothetical protein DPMN_070510 [Dreissena polymorpha]
MLNSYMHHLLFRKECDNIPVTTVFLLLSIACMMLSEMEFPARKSRWWMQSDT